MDQTDQQRFYYNKFPKEQDLVVVEVVEVQENASYVGLLEYGGIRGMITPNELSKYMQGGMQKALKTGKQQVVRVLRVDEDQGYIDLSKKKVAKGEEDQCKQRFADAKMVHSIMRAIEEKCKITIAQLYDTIVFPLQQDGHDVLQVFKGAQQQGAKKFNKLKIAEEIQIKLMEEIERRLRPDPINIKCEFELISYDYSGILVIKEALEAGLQKHSENYPLSFEMKASPIYFGKMTTTSKNGLQVMQEALQDIESVMKKHNGLFKIKQEVFVYIIIFSFNKPKIMGDANQMNIIQEEEDEDNQNNEEGEIVDDDDDIGMQ